MKRSIVTVTLAAIGIFAQGHAAELVRVLVWDERQDKQAEAYENFLGNEIAKRIGEVGLRSGDPIGRNR